ncbi:hypothetical protein COL62_34895 [Bacillus toyonensis]|nr:hypothetical protein CN624_25865 [Bacillus toyonensis]PFY53756.1 hypothetical protein COL62_34895 [Bacillus toyonensis]
MTPNGNFVYAANANSDNVSVIDTSTNAVTTTIPGGSFPRGVAITPNGNLVYVTNESSDNVSVIDTSTNAVTTTIPVGDRPFGIAIK